MLGLGIAVTVGKRILGGVIESLMSTLRGRAEYSENNTDSKAVVKDIDNYELLDKATILLTPTATSNAIVHSVKTYTGDELVTNGTFDTDSDWSKGNKWSISGGTANKATDATSNISQAIDGISGKLHKVVFTVSNYGGNGGVGASADGSNYTQNEGNGTFTEYITPNSNNLYIRASYSFVGSIDNISVIDVSSDFDFDRASSATRINSSGLVQDMQSITDPELVLNGDFEELGNQIVNISSLSGDNWTADGSGGFTNNGSGEGLSGRLDVSTIVGKTYKFTFDVTISGIANATFGGVTIPVFTTSGSKEYYVTATSSSTSFSFYLAPSGSPSMFVNNISVQQVDPNDRWTLGTGWSIEDGVATCDGTQTSISSLTTTSGLSIQNKLVEVIFDLTRTAGSLTVTLQGTGSNDLSNLDSNGTYSFLATSVDSTSQLLFKANTDFIGTIDNVSVKDITFSTDVDLARINYDSNGENGHILLEPTSTNLIDL